MKSGKSICLMAAAVLGAGVMPIPAEASFYSGEELLKVCTAQRGSAAYVENTYECIAYITGSVDAFNTYRRTTSMKSCIPEDVTIAQLRRVTVAYLQDNPGKREEAGSALVFAATRQAWPCAKKAR